MNTSHTAPAMATTNSPFEVGDRVRFTHHVLELIGAEDHVVYGKVTAVDPRNESTTVRFDDGQPVTFPNTYFEKSDEEKSPIA